MALLFDQPLSAVWGGLLSEPIYIPESGKNLRVRDVLHRLNEPEFQEISSDFNHRLIWILDNILNDARENLPRLQLDAAKFGKCYMTIQSCERALNHLGECDYRAGCLEAMLVFAQQSEAESIEPSQEVRTISKAEQASNAANVRWAPQRKRVAELTKELEVLWCKEEHRNSSIRGMKRLIERMAEQGEISLDDISDKGIREAVRETKPD